MVTRSRVGVAMACGLALLLSGTARILAACTAFEAGAATQVADASIHRDGDAPDVQGGVDAGRPDARPPTSGNCLRRGCEQEPSSSCTEEGCGTPDGGGWTTMKSNDGAMVLDTDCYAQASQLASSVYKIDSLPNAPRFFFELGFLFSVLGSTDSVIASVGVEGQRVRIEVDLQDRIRLCRLPTLAGPGELCTPFVTTPIHDPSSRTLRIYGKMGSAETTGSAILQISDGTTCVESGSLELDGPFVGTDAGPCLLYTSRCV